MSGRPIAVRTRSQTARTWSYVGGPIVSSSCATASASFDSGAMCSRFCFVVAAGLIHTLRFASICPAVRWIASPMRAAGQQGELERERGGAAVVAIECGEGGLDLGCIEEDLARRLGPPLHALGRVAVDQPVVLKPRQEGGQHRERAVGLERRALCDLAMPKLDGVAGDRLRLALAEPRDDVAVEQAAIALAVLGRRVRSTTPRHCSARSATRLPRCATTLSPTSALRRIRVA